MYENITKDGVYRLQLSASNPYARFLLVKTYGDKQKKKCLCSMEDVKQQVAEWDDDYCKIDPSFDKRGLDILFGKKKSQEERKPAKNYYSVFDKEGNLYMQGFGSDIAEKFGCKSKTVCNAANDKERRLVQIINGKKLMYDVIKSDQPQKDEWIIDLEVCW